MSAMFWLVVVGLVLFLYVSLMLIAELRQLRGVLAERVGSLAESTWRVRDELAEINKRLKNPT
jgi:hypothetical protein